MTYTIVYRGFKRTYGMYASEHEAVAQFCADLRKEQPDIHAELFAYRRSPSTLNINGEVFDVVGMNQSGNRIAYRNFQR